MSPPEFQNFAVRISWCIILALTFVPASNAERSVPNVKHNRVRIYFIAADEIAWDYAPSGQEQAMGHPFDEFEKNYMEPGPHKIGADWMKASARFFQVRKKNELLRLENSKCLLTEPTPS